MCPRTPTVMQSRHWAAVFSSLSSANGVSALALRDQVRGRFLQSELGVHASSLFFCPFAVIPNGSEFFGRCPNA